MKVALINGSPHEKGCTYTALREVQKQLEKRDIESTITWIGTEPTRGCIGCYACKQTGTCVFPDEAYNKISKEIHSANGVVLGSPVYYASINGTFSAILDKVFFSAGQEFQYKLGAAVVSCRRGGASASFDQINRYFTVKRMPIVSSQYWNSVHGNTPEEVMQDEEGLQTMRTLADNMAWMLKSLQKSEISPYPEGEQISTNFIR